MNFCRQRNFTFYHTADMCENCMGARIVFGSQVALLQKCSCVMNRVMLGSSDPMNVARSIRDLHVLHALPTYLGQHPDSKKHVDLGLGACFAKVPERTSLSIRTSQVQSPPSLPPLRGSYASGFSSPVLYFLGGPGGRLTTNRDSDTDRVGPSSGPTREQSTRGPSPTHGTVRPSLQAHELVHSKSAAQWRRPPSWPT